MALKKIEVKETTKTREFHYNGQVIPDPSPALSPAQAIATLVPGFPEFANAKIEPGRVEGDKMIYRISVAVGMKG